jgi:hypothetical protein
LNCGVTQIEWAIIRGCRNLFQLHLPGVHILIPAFLVVVHRVFAEVAPSPQQPAQLARQGSRTGTLNTVSTPVATATTLSKGARAPADVRQACTLIISSWLCLPYHFEHTPLLACPLDYSQASAQAAVVAAAVAASATTTSPSSSTNPSPATTPRPPSSTAAAIGSETSPTSPPLSPDPVAAAAAAAAKKAVVFHDRGVRRAAGEVAAASAKSTHIPTATFGEPNWRPPTTYMGLKRELLSLLLELSRTGEDDAKVKSSAIWAMYTFLTEELNQLKVPPHALPQQRLICKCIATVLQCLSLDEDGLVCQAALEVVQLMSWRSDDFDTLQWFDTSDKRLSQWALDDTPTQATSFFQSTSLHANVVEAIIDHMCTEGASLIFHVRTKMKKAMLSVAESETLTADGGVEEPLSPKSTITTTTTTTSSSSDNKPRGVLLNKTERKILSEEERAGQLAAGIIFCLSDWLLAYPQLLTPTSSQGESTTRLRTRVFALLRAGVTCRLDMAATEAAASPTSGVSIPPLFMNICQSIEEAAGIAMRHVLNRLHHYPLPRKLQQPSLSQYLSPYSVCFC